MELRFTHGVANWFQPLYCFLRSPVINIEDLDAGDFTPTHLTPSGGGLCGVSQSVSQQLLCQMRTAFAQRQAFSFDSAANRSRIFIPYSKSSTGRLRHRKTKAVFGRLCERLSQPPNAFSNLTFA
jgi:hypothetical protein